MKTLKKLVLIGGILLVSTLGSFSGKRFYQRILRVPPKATEEELAELTPISPAPLTTPEPERARFRASPHATPSAAPITLKPVGTSALLPPTSQVYQTFNNCGPATLSMILGFYDIKKSQKEIADEIRPFQHPQGKNDDKTVFPEEFSSYVKNFGLSSLVRPAGNIGLIKQFLANGFPVTVKQWLHKGEDIGHFRIVKGFTNEILITDDSYDGPNRKISYKDFLELWQSFNYGYVLVYPPSEQKTVETILGERLDLTFSFDKAMEIAFEEIKKEPKNVYPLFNLSTSFYHLGDYQKSVEFFEKVESELPRRMLWYQIEPILAYQKLGNFDRVFALTEKIFASGNPAFSELYLIRGEIYLSQGEKAKAKAEFEKAAFYNKNLVAAQEALESLKEE